MPSSIQDPGIVVINNFLTDEECNSLVDYLDKTNNIDAGSSELRKICFDPKTTLFKNISLRCLSKSKDLFSYENLYIVEYLIAYYETGFNLELHSDFGHGREYFEVTATAYLNDEFTGGDIVFPKLNYRHSPKKGDVAFFLSKKEEHDHEVEVITSGRRYVMPIWMTDQKDKSSRFIHKV